jgi:hypothetical protein
LKVPIADTLFIGPSNTVKLLHNDSRGNVQAFDAHLDQQCKRDQFLELCVDKFIKNSEPISQECEPVYNRIVGVLKKPCSNGNRCYTNQNSDLLFPVSLYAHVLDIAEGNSQQCIIQKFIKSKGKRPSIFRLFWKASSTETGVVEGWNITKTEGEFRIPEIILSQGTGGGIKEESLSGIILEEHLFRKQTTKLIASFLLAGEQYLEMTTMGLDSKDADVREEKGRQSTANPWDYPQATLSPNKRRSSVVLSEGKNLSRGISLPLGSDTGKVESNFHDSGPNHKETMDTVPAQFRKKKNIFHHSKDEINQYL